MGMKQERAAEATRGWHLPLKLQDLKDRPSASLQLKTLNTDLSSAAGPEHP